jgi:hypothetical protein
MSSLSPVLALLCITAQNAHLDTNPVYRALVEGGVAVAADERVRLVRPTMRDGLDAAAARAAIEAIPERHVPVDELLRDSVVAPLVFRFREVASPDPRLPVQGVDVWYVAYGDLEVLARREFLEQAFDQSQQDAKLHVLSVTELKERGIAPVASGQAQQRYVHSVFPLMDRVELSVTTRNCVSRARDSLVVAGMVDPRFRTDEQFPNEWRPLERAADGKLQRGPARPYWGAGAYLKVTRLAAPRGALLVEYHLVFTEPAGWFHGANLLRSKLPILIQSQARMFRRQLAKASQEG